MNKMEAEQFMRLVDEQPIGIPARKFANYREVADLMGGGETWKTGTYWHTVTNQAIDALYAKVERMIVTAMQADPTITPETHVLVFQSRPVNPDRPYELPLPSVRLLSRDDAAKLEGSYNDPTHPDDQR